MNIVLICLDSVRKDFFEKYSSQIQRVADLSFDQCRAASSWSVPSHGSMLTGELPSKHGAHAHNMSYSHLSKSDTFLDQLPNYEAVGVSANAFAGPGYDFDSAFDSYRPVSDSQRYPISSGDDDGSIFNPVVGPVAHITKGVANVIIKKVNEASIEWSGPKLFDDGAKVVTRQSLSQLEDTTEPFFLFVNYMDAHLPLRPTWGYNSELYSVSRGVVDR